LLVKRLIIGTKHKKWTQNIMNENDV